MAYNQGYSNGNGSSYYSSPSGGRKRGRDYDDMSGNGNNGGGYGYGNNDRRQSRRMNDHDQPIASYRGNDYSAYSGRPDRRNNGGGGGGRGGYGQRRNDRDRDIQVLLSVGEKYCMDLWRFGEGVDATASPDEGSRFPSLGTEDIEGLKEETKEVWARGSSGDVLRGFRIVTAECPHKLPYIATLLGLLSNEPFTPPASRIPSKPLVTLTNTVDSGTGTLNNENGDNGQDGDTEMKATSGTAQTPITPQAINLGLEIVKDLVKAFQNHLDARRWRSVRFSLHLFAHLASLPKPLISPSSLLTLLSESFISPLENEPGLRAERGDELVRVTLETLLRLQDVVGIDGEAVGVIGRGVQSYMGARTLDVAYLGGGEAEDKQWVDPINSLYQAFLSSSESGSLPTSLPTPYEEFTSLSASSSSTFEPFQLPVISLPIDTEEGEGAANTATTTKVAIVPQTPVSARGARGRKNVQSEEVDDFARDQVGYTGTRLNVTFFQDETTPPIDTKSGIFLRQLVADIISVYEVNRKVCARILLVDLPRWLANGTFKSSTTSSGAAASKSGNDGSSSMVIDTSGGAPGSPIIIENLIMESILSQLFSTPSTPHKAVYYHSLIGELCKVSPQTVAPSLGKCIRKLYAGLGKTVEEKEEGIVVLNAEGTRRFAEWFAVHLSNFGFHWRWPEWESDLSLPVTHPKKVLISRVLELEIRLSYWDRIKATIPEAYLSSSAGVFASEAPGPDFSYEADGPSAYSAAAGEILKLMRSRGTTEELKEMLESYKKDMLAGEIDEAVDEETAERICKDITFQSILSVGSRSFSHFLNILERYIVLLREFTGSSNARLALLRSVSRFWRRNTQFRIIVIDKLLQYRIVDPVDVVGFIFSGEQPILDGEMKERDWTDVNSWDVLKMTLEKVQTRVLGANTRLEFLRKKEENRLDAERASKAQDGNNAGEDGAEVEGGNTAMATDTAEENGGDNADEAKKEDPAAAAAAEMAAVERQLASVKKEQEALIVEVVKRFHETLDRLGKATSDGDADGWQLWFAKGWFAEFTRAFAKDLYRQLEPLAHIDLPSDSVVYQGLSAAHRWVEFA